MAAERQAERQDKLPSAARETYSTRSKGKIIKTVETEKFVRNNDREFFLAKN